MSRNKPAGSFATSAMIVGILTATNWAMASATETTAATTPAPATTASPTPSSTAAPAPAQSFEEWSKDIKNPTPWFTWGGDLRFRSYYTNNMQTFSRQTAGHERQFERYRPRIWGTFKLNDDIELNTRFTWELFSFSEPEFLESTTKSEGLIDNLNVVFKNFLTDGAKLTVGRQDIVLGDGWLVGDGNPLDGSRTGFYDGVRYTFDMKDIETTTDLIYFDNHANTDAWLHPVNMYKPEIYMAEQDERGAILYFTNKSIEDTEISPYFMYKNADKVLAAGYNGDIYAPGLRYVHKVDENWRYKAEGAYEFGSKDSSLSPGERQDLNAWGVNTQLSYYTNDAVNTNYRLSYEYLSGDRPGTEQNEGFDVLWGRWARWNELYTDAWAMEGGRPSDYSNMHRFGPGMSFNPTKKTEVCTDYYLLFADQNTFQNQAQFSEGGAFRGQLWSTILRYNVSRNIKHLLELEFFLPGNYYSNNNNDFATCIRYELMLTF